ncbi:AIPR family protein [Marinilactibacillus psychrotolerans]|uniref:AIPR family protein n=1 Tax=Marinilactibacillus psychrotolerans TaxID=191770 RepID=UPI003889CAB8
MESYREELVNDIKSMAQAEMISDREAFFELYLKRLEEAEIIEDYHYLYFSGKSGVKNVQIDGYAYNELDQKLSIFIMPPLAYYEERNLTKTEASTFFKRAKTFFFEAEKVITGAEESSEGFGLAYDIVNQKMKVSVLELNIITDLMISSAISTIDNTQENGVRIDYSIYDIGRMKVMDESQGGKEPLLIKLKEDFDCDGIRVLPASKTKDYEAYLCNIPGLLLAQMYDKYQSRLLEGNVRSFLQTRGKVNKGIRKTILTEPEMFFAYNNGIAATSESLEIEETPNGPMIKSIKGLQIVNGGQTTASLANAYTNDIRHGSRESIVDIFVPMKISVVNYDNAQELVPNISRYANSQNKVSDADLASNHPFHIKVEELSRRIVAPAVNGNQFGTYWYYERANGQYRQETYKKTASAKKNFESRNPKKQMFKKVDLAKYINIYHQKPHIASAGAQKSFNKFSGWMVKEWDKNPNFVSEAFFKKVVGLRILFVEADKIVRQQEWYDSYKANIVAYTLSAIFHKVEKEYPGLTIDIQSIWKNQKLSRGWIKQIQRVSKVMYIHLIDPNRTVENVTEWAKREISWNKAKETHFDFVPEFSDELLNKQYVKTQEYASVKEVKKVNELTALVDVYQLEQDEPGFWKEVYEWGIAERIWNIQDKSFLMLAMNQFTNTISDKQAVKIMKVLEKARVEAFPK